MKQRTQEWFDARKGKITMSKVKAIMTGTGTSVGAYSYMAELVQDFLVKDEFKRDLSDLPAIKHGTEYEPEALSLIRDVLGYDVKEVGFIPLKKDPKQDKFYNNLVGFVGGSPDGIIKDDQGDILLEIKCPYTLLEYTKTLIWGVGDLEKNNFYKQYKPQIQGNMLVTGLQRAKLFLYHPGFKDISDNFIIIDIERDEKYIQKMIMNMNNFIEKYKEILKIKNIDLTANK